MNEVLENLRAWDLKLLFELNVAWASPDWDTFWSVITQLHKMPWFMLAILPSLVLYLAYIYRWHALKPILALAVAVGIADAIAYRGIKSWVDRPRPFQNGSLTWVKQKFDAHGPSFPSNHAANCFAGACILSYYFRQRRYTFYVLATLVALSRPALGVHYPSDVLAGAILGLFVGFMLRVLLISRFTQLQLPIRVSEQDVKSADWRSRAGREIRD